MIAFPSSVADVAAPAPGFSSATIIVPAKVTANPNHEMGDKRSLRNRLAIKAVHMGVDAMIKAVLLAEVLKIPIKNAT